LTIEDLIKICKPVDISGDEPYAIRSLQQDSRQVKEDDVFIAIRGMNSDGHQFIEDAIARGASIIICEEPYYTDDKGVSIIEVEETRPLLGKLAQAFQGNPSKSLTNIAVTGTNGKTTVATLVWQVLNHLGEEVGLLGTVTKHYGGKEEKSRLTTADPVEIATDMKNMLESGCTIVSMEVSSHALDQLRTSGIEWDVAAYTNLSHDHLDYHKSMENYAAAKKRLFDSLDSTAWAVINFDDSYGELMVENCDAKIIDFSFKKKTSIQCTIVRSNQAGSLIKIDDIEVKTPLVGTFNAYNVTEAFLICTALGYDAKEVSNALSTCFGAPGRLEKVNKPTDKDLPLVIVDYAHTPNALENVASTLSDIKESDQPLVIVFGCGGDRDKAKRPEMAKVAEAYGDTILVTSDNPRSESPESILKDIESGFSGKANWKPVVSRKEAIETAIREAPAYAIILIAGKGHETYQEINGDRLPFDDREIAREALDNRNSGKKSGEAR
jgi:UDP-N-acetylmuramoyl-L-alanyl-D-glutamate--2,6-diaminopimelate ligase